MILSEQLDVCPLCRQGPLVPYLAPSTLTGRAADERMPASDAAHGLVPEMASRQRVRVCQDCGGAVLHAW